MKTSVCRLNIVKKLVKMATTPETFDLKVAESIIKKNLKDVWEEKNKNVLDEDVKGCLLHLAVIYEKIPFIQMFLDEYPQSLSQERGSLIEGSGPDNKDKFPLWYNNHKWNGRTFDPKKCEPGPRNGQNRSLRAEIRDMIVTKMIHEIDMNLLSDILHRSLGMYSVSLEDHCLVEYSS